MPSRTRRAPFRCLCGVGGEGREGLGEHRGERDAAMHPATRISGSEGGWATDTHVLATTTPSSRGQTGERDMF